MREIKSITAKKHYIFVISIILLIVIMTIPIFIFYFRSYRKIYIPPSFESRTEEGIPQIDEDKYGYSLINVGEAYSLKICGEPEVVSGRDLSLYLTNLEGNNVLIKCEVYNSDGDLLGGSGLLSPNTYVKNIKLNDRLDTGEHTVDIKILAYEPDTYYSMGSAKLKTNIIVE